MPASDEAAGAPLRHAIDALQLSIEETASLFGVSPTYIATWLNDGVPAAHQARLREIADVLALLDRKLASGRLPDVARRRAPAYGGQSILGLLAAGRGPELLDIIRRSFTWSGG